MFTTFVNQAKTGAVLQDDVYGLIKNDLKSDLKISTFGSSDSADWQVKNYQCTGGRSYASFNGSSSKVLPSAGMHTAMNSAAAAALLKILTDCPEDSILDAVLNTHGVSRRFDFHGRTVNGTAVYDDYAHNPEKVANIISAAQELVGNHGKVMIYFQPHGYGPFGFMRDELGKVLAKTLRWNDRFYLAEPFYAGGTSSFSPSAGEVLESWLAEYSNLSVCLAPERKELKKLLIQDGTSDDIILIMGARDKSLVLYAKELTC